MAHAFPIPGFATPPDRVRDLSLAEAPEGIAQVLLLARILSDYGRHIIDAMTRRAVWPGFATVAQFFGTAKISVIEAHITRGIMRALALERVLVERALRRRDLVVLAPRVRASRAGRPAAAPGVESEAGAQPAEAPSAPERARRVRSEPEELALHDTPDMRQLYNEVRRNPIGRTLVAICRDLGIAPMLCTGPFWDNLFMALRHYRGSLPHVVLEMRRREKRFDKEDWKHPHLPFPEQTREGVKRVLGFFIGETPVDTFKAMALPGAAVAGVATGPP